MKRQRLIKAWSMGSGLAALAWLVFSANAIKAQSLVPNHDFEIISEDTGEPIEWFKGGPWSYVTDDDSDRIGRASVAIIGNGGDWRSMGFELTQGQTYQWSVDYKVMSGSTGSIRADFRLFDFAGPGGTFGTHRGEQAMPIADVSLETPDVWQTLGPFTFTTPVTGQPLMFGDIRISGGLFGDAFSGEIRFDNVIVAIPEPTAVVLAGMGVGLVGLAARRSR